MRVLRGRKRVVMKRALPFALLVLALPTVAFATSIYTTGDFVRGTLSGFVATSTDFPVTASLATMTLDTRALNLTPGAQVVPGSAHQALFLLIAGPPPRNFASSMPLEIARVTAAIPEPGTLGLLGAGLIGLAAIVRWKLRGTKTRVPKGIKALRDEAPNTTRASVGLETTAAAAAEVNDPVMPRAA